MTKSRKLGGIFDPDALKVKIDELEAKTAVPEFWNDRENAEKVLGTLKRLKSRKSPR